MFKNNKKKIIYLSKYIINNKVSYSKKQKSIKQSYCTKAY